MTTEDTQAVAVACVRMISLVREDDLEGAAAVAEELGVALAVAGLCSLVLGVLDAFGPYGFDTDELLARILDR